MKLSMWILADKLSHFTKKININDGAARISGIRFFSEDLSELSPDHIYIGKGSDVFSAPDYHNAVVLVNGYDLMFIEDQTIEAVLNEVLSAFDFYNAWEASLWAASASENAVQRMVDLCGGVMNSPFTIADSGGHIIAFTKSDDPLSVDTMLRQPSETGMVPNQYTSSQIRDLDGRIMDDWLPVPHLYRMEDKTCIGSQIMVDGEYVAAFCMYEFKKKLTQGDVQLADFFCGVLASVVSMRNANSEIKSGAAIITSILDGNEPETKMLAKLDEFIAPKLSQCLILIRSTTANVNIVRKNTLVENIRAIGLKGISLVYGHDVISIIHNKDIGHFTEALARNINMEHYVVGVSMPFTDWPQLLSRHKQALFAVEKSSSGSGLFYCQDYAFEWLLSKISEGNRELELLHPALATLSSGNKKSRSQLYETLRQYLINERNTVKTAEDLHIHRNTMKYRLHRINDCINTDLSDPKVRMHILLSYYLVADTEQQ